MTESGKTVVRQSSLRSTVIHEAKQLDFRHFRGVQRVDKISDLYKVKKMLGAGAFGKVYEARNIKANVLCAIKAMEKRKVYG